MADITPEQVQLVRDGYAAGKPIRELMAAAQLKRHQIYRCVNGELAGPGGAALAPLPQRIPGRSPQRSRGRKTLVARLWRMADQQVRDIEERLQLDGQEPVERERDARMLATMVKTLRELRALDAQQAKLEPPPQDEHEHQSLDDFRRELARKMDNIIARRTDRGAGDAEP